MNKILVESSENFAGKNTEEISAILVPAVLQVRWVVIAEVREGNQSEMAEQGIGSTGFSCLWLCLPL